MDSASRAFADQLDRQIRHAPTPPMVYKIQTGDTLNDIIHHFYDARPGSNRFNYAMAALHYLNRNLNANPDSVRSGDILQLMALPANSATADCPKAAEFARQVKTQTRPRSHHFLEPGEEQWRQTSRYWPNDLAERDAFWALSWLESKGQWLNSFGGSGRGTAGEALRANQTQLLKQVDSLEQQFRSNMISKGHYDYLRGKALANFATQIGSIEKLLFPDLNPRDAARISRSRTIPAARTIPQNASRLCQLAEHATRAGVLVTAFGSRAPATAPTATANEVFVEKLPSRVGGINSGVLVIATLVTGSAAKGIALGIATGPAAATWQGSQPPHLLYDKHQQAYDLRTEDGLLRLCR